MSFRTSSVKPYTKEVTVQEFVYSLQGKKYNNLQNDLKTSIDKLASNEIHIDGDVYLKVRKSTIQNNKVLCFLSYFDKKGEISTTGTNASDKITKVNVNNADERHLFLCIDNNKVAVMQTIFPLNLKSYLHRSVSNLLKYGGFNTKELKIIDKLNDDKVALIQEEGLSKIVITGEFDLLAAGIPKVTFLDKIFGGTQTNVEHENVFGQLELSAAKNKLLVEIIENNLDTTVDNLSGEVVIWTKQRSKISNDDLFNKRKYYFQPIGKTKTITTAHAFEALIDFIT